MFVRISVYIFVCQFKNGFLACNLIEYFLVIVGANSKIKFRLKDLRKKKIICFKYFCISAKLLLFSITSQFLAFEAKFIDLSKCDCTA